MAHRKVEGLLAAGARTRVISPQLVPELVMLRDTGVVEVLSRCYENGDLAGAFLVIAATDNPQVNQNVWVEAMQSGCLVNVVDDPQHSNFTLPAVVRRGDLCIAISTGGSSPALARRLREQMESLVGPAYEVLADLMAELRPELMANFPAGEPRLQAALRVIDSDILEVIRDQGREAALSYGREKLHER